MKLNYVPPLLLLMVHVSLLRAMEDKDLQAGDNFFNHTLQDAQDYANSGSHPASSTTVNPLAGTLPPRSVFKLPPPVPLKPALAGSGESNKNANPFLLPSKKRSAANLFTLDDYIPLDTLFSDNDIPSPVQACPVVAQAPTESKQELVDAIISIVKRESLRKFTYDMESMQLLNEHAYAITLAYLKLWREQDKDFLFTRKITSGTPDIIRYIEEHTRYRFPENIVVRTKEYPHASSLADIACFTEKRVREQKTITLDIMAFASPHKSGIAKDIYASTYFIQDAVNQYLEEVKARENETPKQKRKRLYSQVFSDTNNNT